MMKIVILTPKKKITALKNLIEIRQMTSNDTKFYSKVLSII